MASEALLVFLRHASPLVASEALLVFLRHVSPLVASEALLVFLRHVSPLVASEALLNNSQVFLFTAPHCFNLCKKAGDGKQTFL